MSIFRTFNISMIPGKPPLIIHVSQYESDFVYTFNLVSGKSALAIPETSIALIRGTKRDGNGFSKEASLDTENNRVVVIGEVQMTACAGRNVFELAIINDEKVICTANFFLDVERAPLDAGTIQSESVLRELQAIIDSAATATQAAEDASASAESAASAAEQAVEEKFEDGVAETIDEWLTDHPEATTTVQDGSLTYKKLVTGTLGFVTPEMFGAKGDGVTDDTQAWQDAVDSGLNVIATNGKTYKIGKVTITNDIDIDCGMCKFVQTASEMFYAEGTVEETTGTTADYIHSNGRYVLSDANKPDYTGYAFLLGTNSLDLSRDYYKCGFPASFKNGYMVETYPIDVENVTVTYYSPITVNIYNILDIEAAQAVKDVGYCNSIHIKYGVNCCVRNVLVSDVHIYMLINIDKCLNTLVEQIYTHSNAENASGNSYHIALMDSCFSNIINCKLNNDNWHCITTGGTTLVYRTVVRDCILETKYQFAYLDHPNAVDTVIDNVIATYGVGISQNGNIRCCKIYASTGRAGYGITMVRLSPSNFSWLGYFDIENVEMVCNDDTADGSSGVNITIDLGNGGVDSERYVNKIKLINVYVTDPTKTKQFGSYIKIHTISLNYPTHVYRIYTDGTNLCYGGCNPATDNVDLDSCEYTVLNTFAKAINESGYYIPFGTSGYTMPKKIYADNFECSYLRGNYTDFIFGTIKIVGFDDTNALFSRQLIGNTINNYNSFSNFERFSHPTVTSIMQIVNGNIIALRKSGSNIVFMKIDGPNLKWFYANAGTSWGAVARAGDLDRSFTQQVTYWTAQEPTQNTYGQLWYDTGNQKLKISNGTSWIDV